MSRPEILLMGAMGYIGSRLYTHLTEAGHAVTGLDRRAPANGPIRAVDYRSLNGIDLAPFGTVIWLAGHSSVKMAVDEPAEAFENNVSGLLRLVGHLQPSQRLIYASSASLYSGNEALDSITTEETIGFQYQNAYDLSKYAFDKLISTIGSNFCGLRFGTVCGTSTQQRDELLLNSMVKSAVQHGVVKVSNQQAKRSVLGMGDLVSTIERMLQVVPPSGFYNLASYSMSIGEFGDAVAEQLNAHVVELSGTGTYNFSVDSAKICKALDRPLTTPLSSLIADIAIHYRSQYERHFVHA
ncbi:MAG: NAD(P)-dependent oxidoreductase [Pseudomonadota bacterium]